MAVATVRTSIGTTASAGSSWFFEAREAVADEQRTCSRSFGLRAHRMDRSPTGDRSIVRIHVGRVELDSSWEGGIAFRPTDFGSKAGHRSPLGTDRYVWVGTVYEIDPEGGDIYVGLNDQSGEPELGDFIIKPFEFTRFLDMVYSDAVGTAKQRLTQALGKAAGKIVPSPLSVRDSGRRRLRALWHHDWTVLWGPPGTGKTYSLGEFVAGALLHPDERLLVVSTTNKATDGAALSIINALRRAGTSPPTTTLLRMGAGASLTSFREANATDLLDGGESEIRAQLAAQRRLLERETEPEKRATLKKGIEELRRQLREADGALFDAERRVIITTAFKAIQILAQSETSPGVGGAAPFTTVVIDEAGLVSRAATAAIALYASRRTVLVGDPRQLAPISRVARVLDPKKLRWLGDSGLAHLDSHALGPAMQMLTVQWRMAPQIRELVSRYQYDGRLQDSETVLERTAVFDLDPLLASQPRAIWYVLDEQNPSAGPNAVRAQRPEKGGSWHRELTLEVLDQLFEHHPKLAGGRGLFVSPFVAQGREVRQWLGKHPVAQHGWKASTVHAQQGAEADYVIFDTVHASSTAWPAHEWTRLINVGLSRAKQLVIFIASRDEMRQPYLAPLVDQMAARVLRGRGQRVRWESVSARVAHSESAQVRRQDPECLGAQLNDRSSMLRLLSREQERLCNMPMDGGPRLVRGVAGSGKTVVMASWVAQTLAGNPRAKLWVVYGNAALHGLLQSTVSTALEDRGLDPQSKQVTYFHVKELLRLLLNRAGLGQKPNDFAFNSQAKRYLDLVGQASPICDAIFVDEAQDMGPDTLRLLHQLVKPIDETRKRRQAVIFFDNAQDIYGRGTPKWSDLGIDMRGRSVVMKESFRSTQPIAEFALNFLYQFTPPRQSPDHRELLERGLVDEIQVGGKPWWRTRFCHTAGPAPQFALFDDIESERNALSHQLLRWIRDDGVRPRDIRVITNQRRDGGYIAQMLEPTLRLVNAKVIAQTGESMTSSDDTVVVSTPHSFKGHDAEIVAVVHADRFVQKELGVLAPNLYVAMTRARSVLWVSGRRRNTGESQRLVHVLVDIDTRLSKAQASRPLDGDATAIIPEPPARNRETKRATMTSSTIATDADANAARGRANERTSSEGPRPPSPAAKSPKQAKPQKPTKSQKQAESRQPTTSSKHAKMHNQAEAAKTQAKAAKMQAKAAKKQAKSPTAAQVPASPTNRESKKGTPRCPCGKPLANSGMESHILARHPADARAGGRGFGRCPLCGLVVLLSNYDRHVARHVKNARHKG